MRFHATSNWSLLILVLLASSFILTACEEMAVGLVYGPVAMSGANPFGDGSGGYDPPVPVHTAGTIVDQYGQPVDRVKVTWNGSTTYSDNEGKFSIQGKGHNDSYLDLQKEGYRYNNNVINSVRTLWRINAPDSLISASVHFAANMGNGVYTVDLIKGTFSLGDALGDLRVIILHDTPVLPGDPWCSVSVEAIDGGFANTSVQTYPFEAPELGYQPKYKPGYGLAYVKSRMGTVFGSIHIDIIMKDNKIFIDIQSLINPAGSRNLESDPKKTFKAGSPAAIALTPSTD